MINREEFEEGITNFHLAKNTSAFVQEEAPAPDSEGVQVASVSGGISREVMNLLNKSSANLVRKRPTKSATESVTLKQVEEQIEAMVGKESINAAESPINRGSIDQIMETAEDENDVKKLIESAATFETQNTPRTFKDIEGDFSSAQDVLDELQPVLKGKQSGLLTDRQLYGVRSLMTTSSDKTVELAEKIAAGDHTPQLLLEYQNSIATYNVLSKYAKGQATEIARALNSQKMVAKAMKIDSLRGMDDAVESSSMGGGEQSIIKSAKNVTARAKKHGNNKAVADGTGFNWLHDPVRVAVEYWKNNILSGWETHAVNITSVAVANTWDNFVIRPVAAGIGSFRQGVHEAVTGAPAKNFDRVYASEILGTIAGSTAGIRGSLDIMTRTLMTGESAFGAGKAEYGGALHKFSRDMGLGKFGEAAADVQSMSFRLLRAEDDVMRGLAFSQQLYALAFRDGSMKGLSGEALLSHANKMIDDPPAEMYDAAADFATKVTFTNTDTKGVIGQMAQHIRGMTGAIPALQFLVPFVNTPSNLLQYAVETSALAPISSKLWKEVQQGGAAKDVALAKMTTGVALTLGLWQLFEAGHVTGKGPEDFKAREMLEREGWKPYAIVSPDGNHYGIERLEPFSTSISMAVGYLNKAKYAKTEEEALKWFTHGVLAMSENTMDSIWMKGINDFYKAFDSENQLKSWASNMASGMVPYSATLKSVKRVMDPVERKVSKDEFVNDMDYQLSQRIKANTPYLSEYVRPARYWDGEVIEPGSKGFAYAVNPVKMGNFAKSDVANRELLKNGVFPKDPSPIFNMGPTKFSLLELDETGQLYDTYIKHVGLGRRLMVEKIIDKGGYGSLSEGPNGYKWRLLTKGIDGGKAIGTKSFLQWLEKEVDQNPKLAGTITKQFGADPKLFIKSLYASDLAGEETEVKTKSIGVPTRKQHEIPRMNK